MALLGIFDLLTLEQKSLVHSYLERFPPEVSELTFTNLWGWSLCHPVWYYEEEGVLYLMERGHDGFFGFMPLGEKSPQDKVRRLGELMRLFHLEFRMERLCESETLCLAPLSYEISEQRDHFDYLYDRTDLSELKGRKYHRKRNHIANCLAEHPCQYVPFSEKLIPACTEFLEEWCRLRKCLETPDLGCEHRAMRFLLHDFKQLRVFGGAIFIEGKMKAVTFAERLNTDTAVIHFEKAHPGIDGLYPLINQRFCQNALSEYAWVNREQDLGVPGLRQAKENYFPARMMKKFALKAKT